MKESFSTNTDFKSLKPVWAIVALIAVSAVVGAFAAMVSTRFQEIEVWQVGFLLAPIPLILLLAYCMIKGLLPNLALYAVIGLVTLDASLPIISTNEFPGASRAEIFLVDIALVAFILIVILFQGKNHSEDRGAFASSGNRIAGGGGRHLILLLVVLLALFLTVLLGSLFKANYLSNGLFAIATFLRAFTLFLALAVGIKSHRQIKSVLALLMVVLLVHSVTAFLQWWTQGEGVPDFLVYLGMTSPTEYHRNWFAFHGAPISVFGRVFGVYVSGFAGSAFRLAAIIELLLPMLMAFYLFGSGKYLNRKVALLTILFAVVALILTVNRTSWLTVTGSMALLIFLGLLTPFGRRRSKRLLKSMALAVLLLVPVVIVLSDLIKTRFLGTNAEISVGYRLVQLSEAVSIIDRNPLLGVGVGNYGAEPVSNIVHNLYLILFAEGGIFAVVTYLLPILVCLAAGLWLVGRSDDELTVLGTMGLVSGVVSYLAHGLTDWVVLQQNILSTFWVVLALIIAMTRIELLRREKRREANDGLAVRGHEI